MPSYGDAPSEISSVDVGALQLAVIVPSYNERGNIELLYQKVAKALAHVAWEMIVVDDNSPDGTAELVNDLSRRHSNIRGIRRFGRRGLASACVEGMAATSAPYVAVIDADHQHDETLLPKMLKQAEAGVDLVIGSRFISGGSAGEGLSKRRLSGSNLANVLARTIAGQDISDPMSGFFLVRRQRAMEVAPRLASDGFKILIDLVVTSTRMGQPLSIVELPYTFRSRHSGDSKMSPLIVVQYLGLWVSKMTGGALPPSFLLFGLVGGTGLFIHLAALWFFNSFLAQEFLASQAAATLVAMTWNFFLNNNLTYADRKLRGIRLVRGLLSFFAICALGAIANISVASTVYGWDHQTFVAGLAGAVMSLVFNYAVTRVLTWK